MGDMVTDIWYKAGVPDVTITLVRSSLSTLVSSCDTFLLFVGWKLGGRC